MKHNEDKLEDIAHDHMQQERTTGDYVHLLELALSGQTISNTLLEEANASYAGIQDELFVAHELIAKLESQLKSAKANSCRPSCKHYNWSK